MVESNHLNTTCHRVWIVIRENKEEKKEAVTEKERPEEVENALKMVDGYTDEIFGLLMKEMTMELGLLVNRNI